MTPGDTPTVFVIDDDESIRHALRSLFLSVGLNVNLFSSASELLNSQPPKCPSCLVLDIRLPGLSGLELQAQLAGDGDALPVILVSGLARERQRRRAQERRMAVADPADGGGGASWCPTNMAASPSPKKA